MATEWEEEKSLISSLSLSPDLSFGLSLSLNTHTVCVCIRVCVCVYVCIYVYIYIHSPIKKKKEELVRNYNKVSQTSFASHLSQMASLGCDSNVYRVWIRCRVDVDLRWSCVTVATRQLAKAAAWDRGREEASLFELSALLQYSTLSLLMTILTFNKAWLCFLLLCLDLCWRCRHSQFQKVTGTVSVLPFTQTFIL